MSLRLRVLTAVIQKLLFTASMSSSRCIIENSQFHVATIQCFCLLLSFKVKLLQKIGIQEETKTDI